MQTAPRPYGGDIERSLCKRHQDRTVATSNDHYTNGTKTVRWRHRTDCEFLRLEDALLRVPSPRGGSYEGNIERTASSFR